MWHVHHNKVVHAGFNMVVLSPLAARNLLANPTDKQLHINILKFIALIINTWFCLWHIHTFKPDKVGSYILSIWGDNTSALSWLQHSKQSWTPMEWCLSQLLVFLLTKLAFLGQIIGSHIP